MQRRTDAPAPRTLRHRKQKAKEEAQALVPPWIRELSSAPGEKSKGKKREREEEDEKLTVNWLHLPDDPFKVIMTVVAQQSLTDLQSCIEVCSAWSDKIEKHIVKNPAVMDTVRDKVIRAFGPDVDSPDYAPSMLPSREQISNTKWLADKNLINIEVINWFAGWMREQLKMTWYIGTLSTCAASLAYFGLLGKAGRFDTYRLSLVNVDLTSVPPEDWAALASWVKWSDVVIHKVSGIGLTSFLKRVNCESLRIKNQNLDRSETQALVQAMDSGVESLHLSTVTLKIDHLVTYSGQGQCRQVSLFAGEDPKMWRVNMKWAKDWAMSRDWAVTNDSVLSLLIKRK